MPNYIEYDGGRIDYKSMPALKSIQPQAPSQASTSLFPGIGGQAMPQQKNPPSISSALMPSPISGFRDAAFENSMASAVNAAFHGSNMRREQAMNQQMPLMILEGMKTIGALGGADGFGGFGGGGKNGMSSQYSNIYNGHLRALTGANQGLNPMSPEEASQKAHQLTGDYFKALGVSAPNAAPGGSVNDIAGSISQSRGGAGAVQPQSDWKSDAQRNMMGMFLSSIEGLYGKKYTSSFGHEYTTGQMPPEIQKNIATLKSMLASSGATAMPVNSPAVQNILKPQAPIDYRATPRQPAPLDEPNQSGSSAISSILRSGGNPISALLTNLLFKKLNGQHISPVTQQQPSGSGGW